MPHFGKRSSDQLKTCSWKWQVILQEVIKYYDCTVLEGHRGEEAQHKNFIDEVSQVDWPDGKHNAYPSEAVDVTPFPIPEDWGALNKNMTIKQRDNAWKERLKFYQLAAIIKFVASSKGIEVRWGGDWNRDGDYRNNKFEDLVHFELL